MKNILTCILLITVMQQAIAQTETFDIATYTAPVNFKKDTKEGVVLYSTSNNTTGSFCLIAIYASTTSAGDEKKDFTKAWKDLAMTAYKAAANPTTETQTSPDGWKVVSAAAPIKLEANDAYTILSVFSGFGKRFCVLATLNDQSYLATIDSLLENIKLNATAIVANPPVAVANATNGQFGNIRYTAPNGWSITKYPDGDIIKPADLPKGEFLEIWVQSSLNFSGTIEQALKKSYDETAGKLNAAKMNEVDGGSYSAVAAKTSFKGWEYIRCSGGIHLGGGDYPPEYGLDLFVVKINNRFEQVAVIKSRNNCNFSRYYPSDKRKYYNDIENFLFSLQFADWKDPVVKTATVKGDGIIGVWQGISLSVGTAKPGAELGAEFKVKQLIFFSNGQAYFGSNFPAEGLDELNTWMKAEVNRRDWGTYSFSNGRGVLKLPYADVPLRMENNKLIITTNKTDHGFVKTNSVDGATFNGTYALSSKDFAGQETGKTPLLRFTSDGKFTDNGALKILYHEYVDCLNPCPESGSGMYEVKNHSLVFNYSDGRKIKIAFIGVNYDKNNVSPASITLSFNEDLLYRK